MPEFTDPSPASGCIFCRIVQGQLPAARVHEDALTVAFMDAGQVNPGHVLVATRRHAASLFDITPEEAAAVMKTAQRIAASIRETLAPPGLTLLQANGKEGWQTVFHFHLHVLPRHADDGVGLVWPRKEPGLAVLQSHASLIAQHLPPP